MRSIVRGVIGYLLIAGSAWGASSRLCSAGESYEVLDGGGCCGDGIVNGPDTYTSAGEECDNGTAFNDWNALFESSPPGTNLPPCSSNCAVTALGGIGNCQPWGNGYHYEVGELGSLTCQGNNLYRKLYDNDTCTAVSQNFGILPNNLYMAGCVAPICDNNVQFGCSAGIAINRNGNDWICTYGGKNLANCSYSSYDSYTCGSDGNFSKDGTCSSVSYGRVYFSFVKQPF